MRLVFDGPDDGTELIRTLSGSGAPSTIEVRFEPGNPNEQLIGTPSELCNSPGGGQALIFDVPVTIDGVTTQNVEVQKAGQSVTVQVRIKITHNT